MLIRAHTTEEAVGIDLTPVIDMVFMLLIFFLVATTFHQAEREIQIALPAASHAAPLSTLLRELVVNVDAQGRIILSGRDVDREALRATVNQAVAANPEQKVTVRGDRATAYANVVAVLDICKAAGIQEPYLDTVLIE
ncbi:MAG: biopolymer transporter ExbD [Planctomycetes bacterium]|nr:biopolymer transporter ExbD [Planctomycetota bacterium]